MDRRIGIEIRELQQSIKHKIEEERSNNGIQLTHGQVRVLMYVHQKTSPSYQKDIEDYLKIRRSTATEILKVLQREDYISRVRCDHDARLKEIVLTSKTLAVVDDMSERLLKMEGLLKENIDADELAVFFKVLDQMKENINEDRV